MEKKKTWALRPFPLCWQPCCGGGLLPSPGPVTAPGWGMPTCVVLAMCINKPPRPESSTSPWALDGQVGKLHNHRGAHMGRSPRSGHPELSARVFRILLWVVELRKQSHISSSEGTLEIIWAYPALCRRGN